ncbi:MAG: hypothetical protein K0R36_2075 [Chryseobacterium sp.]|jgi:hypothetical protein|nr:hypothetical protein [Chryseobacterium sp.]
MKIKWREYEMVFVTLWAAIVVVIFLMRASAVTDMPAYPEIHRLFLESGRSYVFWKNELLPKIAVILLYLSSYFFVNLILMPTLKRNTATDFGQIVYPIIIKPIIYFVLISFILALGVNALSYVALPHLISYRGYQGLALLGYNDHPLTDLFFGLPRALAIIAFLLVSALIREVFIAFLGRPGNNREFRVLFCNTCLPLVFLYLLILLLLGLTDTTLIIFIAVATPILIFWVYLTFWFFPLSDQSLTLPVIVLRLFPIAAILSIFCLLLINAGLYGLWAMHFFCVFLIVFVTPGSWLLYNQRGKQIRQLKYLETRVTKSDADLKFLRSQINPHFLFNALNTLYGVALMEKSDNTADGIQKLGDMMRFMLHENNQEIIPLEKEVTYLQNYIEFQKLRTRSSSDIVISHDLDIDECEKLIAPMLLVPFVENAFKHGISSLRKSWVTASLECNETTIVFKVNNSMHPQQEFDHDKHQSGIGLENVRQRLRLIYPGNHVLEIRSDNVEFSVTLTINLKSKNDA